MLNHAVFAQAGNGFRWLVLIFLMMIGTLAGMLAGYVIQALFGISDNTSLEAMRIMQLSTQLGLFFLPSLVWSLLFEVRTVIPTSLKTLPQTHLLALGAMLMLISLPLVHSLSEWNQSIKLPEALSTLEDKLKLLEDSAETLTKKFLSVTTLSGLMFNLLMIAVIPAVGEELLFRNVIQNLLLRSIRNAHIAIVLGALIFSALHFQFYGLVPRFLLGLFLGYFFFWSGSLWVPVMMHFLNNGLAVVAYYLHFNGASDIPMEDFGSATAEWQWVLSAMLSIFVVLGAYRYRHSI